MFRALDTRVPAREALWFYLLLVLHVALVAEETRWLFPTRNEVAHVPAGVSYWKTGSFGMYCVNPPLGKLVATAPTLLLSPTIETDPLWETPGGRFEWEAARRFAADNPSNYFTLIGLARLTGIGWSVAGAWLIRRWANALYCRPAGLLATAMWCFGPNILGHAGLVTPDVPAATAGLAATYAFWHYLRAGTWKLAAVAAMLLGIAQLTKFTLLALYAVWPVLAVARAADGRNALPYRTQILHGGFIVALSVLVINVGYGFEGSLSPLGGYDFVSRSFTGLPAPEGSRSGIAVGNRFRGTIVGDLPVPLPRHYLRGIDIQRRDFEAGPQSYLRGEWRDHGWWYFYLYALAVKVPLGYLALAVWGLLLTLARSRLAACKADELALWLPAVTVLTLVSSQTGFTHHFRYVLPAFPFVCVATGKLACYLREAARPSSLIVLSLLGWAVADSLSVYPYSLSYFNQLAGGPDHGQKHLLDSNTDWGQDLFFLKAWADRHPDARPLGLAYFNYVDPNALGIAFDAVPPDPGLPLPADDERAAAFGPHPGWFAADAHNLFSPNGRCRYLQRFRPVAKAGYSIFIYQIAPSDARRVRLELGLPPLPE